MRRSKFSWFLLCSLMAAQSPVYAEQFNVGDNVILLGDRQGTVTELGGPSGQIRVKFKFTPPGSSGGWYDPHNLKHGGGGAGGNAPPAAPPDNPPPANPAGNPPAAPAGNGAMGGGADNGQFKVGDKVILLGRYEGTVTAVGGPSGQIKVKTRTGPANSDGSWYEPGNLKHGGGGDAGGSGFDPGVSSGTAPANPAGNAIRNPVQVPNNAAPGIETFKKIIESHSIPDWGQTIFFDFQNFQPLGNAKFNNAYAGNLSQATQLGGPGDVYNGLRYHVKFVQRTRHDDPLSRDEVVTQEGDYTFFKDKNGEWFGKSDNIQKTPTRYQDKR